MVPPTKDQQPGGIVSENQNGDESRFWVTHRRFCVYQGCIRRLSFSTRDSIAAHSVVLEDSKILTIESILTNFLEFPDLRRKRIPTTEAGKNVAKATTRELPYRNFLPKSCRSIFLEALCKLSNNEARVFMLLMILRVAYLLICAGAILAYINSDADRADTTYTRKVVGGQIEMVPISSSGGAVMPAVIRNNKATAFFVLLGISQLFTVVDLFIRKKQIDVISGVYFGVLIGILLAYLFIQALTPVLPETHPYHTIVVLITLLVLPYICVSLLLQTKDDFRFVIPYVEFQRDLKSGRPLVVDSSSLIDGRIADVVETQIIESQLIVPDFILAEVQDVADSSDKNRRIRGRRGLEVLAKMQQSVHVDVKVMETNRADYKSMTVDQKVVALAKQVRGGVITNDFNLNKVASVQGIPVINLNDVSNSLRPRYIPGERLQIKIIKEGEGPGQGVGYLDDGTMVVCENAAHLAGKEISVIVTSVLQSSAGRMIFGKMVYKAEGEG